MVVPPTRNSEPFWSMAARTRSSSKKVPLVESRSFRLANPSRISRRQWWRETSGSLRAISAPFRPITARSLDKVKERPSSGPDGDAKNGAQTRWKIGIVVDSRSFHACRGGVGTGERGHRRDDHGFVDAALHLDNGGLATLGAAKLNFGMLGQHGIVQQMLLPTMNAARLHTSKLSRREEERRAGFAGFARRVTR